MRILSKIFKCVSEDESKGISLRKGPCWEVSRIRDSSAFFRALSDLIPSNSILFIEGTSTSKDIQRYLEARKPDKITKVSLGTVWPRPNCFHMLATPENLEGLAKLADSYAAPEVADHIHVYTNGEIILEWHDAFSDPVCISKVVPEDKIKNFCSL